MELEYDPEKSERNVVSRGLGFEQARELFEGEHAIVTDARKDYREQRLIAYGHIGGRLHVCVHTVRGGPSGSSRCAAPTGERSMPMVRITFEEARRRAKEHPVDWARIDAMTDEDIARQIAADPDVALDMSEALERGEFIRLHVFNVFALRTRLGPTHEAFAARFGLDPDEVRRWEAMGGVPAEAIRTYFRVIDREPEAVARAVAAASAEERQPANAD